MSKKLSENEVIDFYTTHLKNVNLLSNGWHRALCPFHDDHEESFNFHPESTGFKCHACGKSGNIFNFASLINVDPPIPHKIPQQKSGREIVAIYDYKDEDGNLVFQTVRYNPKDFVQRRPDPNSTDGKGFIYNLKGITRIPYRLPELINSSYAIVVEGEKDADALILLGLVATTIPLGAGKWMPMYNKYFRGKRVAIIPDNDEPGHSHAEKIATSIFDIVKSLKIVNLPDIPEKGDTSDFIEIRRKKAGLTTEQIKEEIISIIKNTSDYVLEKNKPKPTIETKEDDKERLYFTDDNGGLYRWKKTPEGIVPVKLSNFDAYINKEIIEDDGVNTTYLYGLTGKQGDIELQDIDIPASTFSSLNWIHKWGTKVILEPGNTVKDYVRHAIQIRSNSIEKVTYYTHTGWRHLNGEGGWAYLSGNGAIGAEGVRVKLSKELQRYNLPPTPNEELEVDAIRTSLSFLEIGKKQVTFPLFAFLYLSPLTTLLDPMPNFSAYLYGETATFKTSTAIAIMSHFGNFTSISNLSNFDDTANNIEKKAFILKDTIMCLDDFHPSSRKHESQNKENIAQRIIRSYANRTARGRLNPDSSDKGRHEPRGMLIVTGEEMVSIQSTLARVMVLELSKNDIDVAKFTQFQDKAKLLPIAMSSYILWIKNNMDKIKELFSINYAKMRNSVILLDIHRKLPEQVAFLHFAFGIMIDWAIEKEAITKKEAKILFDENWEILNNLFRKENERIQIEDPVKSFIGIIQTLIYQHKIRIEDKHNRNNICIGGSNGELIGYYDETYFYFLPLAIWHSLQQYCIAEGLHFPFSKNTLYKVLKDRKIIEERYCTMRTGNDVKKVIKIHRLNFTIQEDKIPENELEE